jgi:hypothetical protein
LNFTLFDLHRKHPLRDLGAFLGLMAFTASLVFIPLESCSQVDIMLLPFDLRTSAQKWGLFAKPGNRPSSMFQPCDSWDLSSSPQKASNELGRQLLF